jgi:hypothetical protein
MTGVTPSKARAALQADALPLLTIVGNQDMTFHVVSFGASSASTRTRKWKSSTTSTT